MEPTGRRGRFTLLGFLLALVSGHSALAELRPLLQKQHCPVYQRIVWMYRPLAPGGQINRFIAISPVEFPDRYVQCLFVDSGRALVCEAASGFHRTPPGQPRAHFLTPTQRDTLVKLGFDPDDSKGNFRAIRPVKGEEDLPAIATFVLTALHDVFDVTAETPLKIVSPKAPNFSAESAICVPIS